MSLFLFLFFSKYAVTMFIFHIKGIISSEKWFNYVVTFFLEYAKNLGGWDDVKQRKKKRMALNVNLIERV